MELAFYLIASAILISGALVAFRPKPIESALWLILNFFLTSALYVLLGSYFTAVIQVLVYAGAIVVLFTFVIMLLNLDPKEMGLNETVPWTSFVMVIGAVLVMMLAFHIATPELLEKMPAVESPSDFGGVEAFSRLLIEKYAWSFEVAGILLLLAVLCVGLLAYRKPHSPATEMIKPDSEKEAA